MRKNASTCLNYFARSSGPELMHEQKSFLTRIHVAADMIKHMLNNTLRVPCKRVFSKITEIQRKKRENKDAIWISPHRDNTMIFFFLHKSYLTPPLIDLYDVFIPKARVELQKREVSKQANSCCYTYTYASSRRRCRRTPAVLTAATARAFPCY